MKRRALIKGMAAAENQKSFERADVSNFIINYA